MRPPRQLCPGHGAPLLAILTALVTLVVQAGAGAPCAGTGTRERTGSLAPGSAPRGQGARRLEPQGEGCIYGVGLGYALRIEPRAPRAGREHALRVHRARQQGDQYALLLVRGSRVGRLQAVRVPATGTRMPVLTGHASSPSQVSCVIYGDSGSYSVRDWAHARVSISWHFEVLGAQQDSV